MVQFLPMDKLERARPIPWVVIQKATTKRESCQGPSKIFSKRSRLTLSKHNSWSELVILKSTTKKSEICCLKTQGTDSTYMKKQILVFMSEIWVTLLSKAWMKLKMSWKLEWRIDQLEPRTWMRSHHVLILFSRSPSRGQKLVLMESSISEQENWTWSIWQVLKELPKLVLLEIDWRKQPRSIFLYPLCVTSSQHSQIQRLLMCHTEIPN
mgnify:CR=1 FL=1